MSIRNLDYLFQPKSVAVIGASDRARSLGATVMRNLLEGVFAGPVWPVNPRHKFVADRQARLRLAIGGADHRTSRLGKVQGHRVFPLHFAR